MPDDRPALQATGLKLITGSRPHTADGPGIAGRAWVEGGDGLGTGEGAGHRSRREALRKLAAIRTPAFDR